MMSLRSHDPRKRQWYGAGPKEVIVDKGKGRPRKPGKGKGRKKKGNEV